MKILYISHDSKQFETLLALQVTSPTVEINHCVVTV